MSHVLRYAARTDRGLLRANNQDSVFAGDRLLVIADGMGGHAAGDVASRLVVAAFVDLDELPLGSDMVRPLTEATKEGNAAIAEMVEENPEFDGMGTTLTALLFDGPVVALAHVGDSRAYLYRNGVLHQISHDDTFVQSLVDDGRITAEEAAHHPQRSLLLRALNGTEMDPSITLRETSAGDRFLICSDGLSDVVSPEAIADALAGPDPDQVADTLIQLALVGGGPDNVTVIVADVVDTGTVEGFGVHAGGIDPEATGPMQPIHLTQVMPSIPLPPIPEDVAAKAEYATLEEGPHPEDDETYEDAADDYESDSDPPDEFVDAGQPAGDRRMVAAPPRHHWRRRWAVGIAMVVLIGVAVSGSVLWAGTKYYVGDNGNQVVVFRGINGSLLGWKFASVQENSCGSTTDCSPLKVGDLVQAARDQVNAGIPVSTLTDARAVITRLNSQQLPPCPTPSAAVSSAAVASSGAASVAPSGTGAAASPGSAQAPPPTPTVSKTAAAVPTTPTVHPATPAKTTSVRTTAAKATPRRTAQAPRTSPRAAISGTPHKPTTAGGATSVRPRTPPSATRPTRTTITLAPPTPVTTTMTVTVDSRGTAITRDAEGGQRLRSGLIGFLASGATSVPPAKATITAAKAPAAVIKRTTAARATNGPVTRAIVTRTTPTVTVTTTITRTPTTTPAPTSTGTPLVSPAAEPGVTCRVVS